MTAGCPPVIDIGCHLLGGAAGGAAGDVAGALIAAVTAGVAAAAGWLVGHVVTLVNASTTVDLAAPWFVERERTMIGLMALLIVPMLGAGTISAIIRQDLRRLARTWAVALPVAVVVTVAAINLTQVALGVGDAMTAVVAQRGDLGAYSSLAQLLVAAPGATSFVVPIISVLVIAGAVSVWLELVVRSAAVYVAVFFLPLALAGLVWPATAHLGKRLVEGLAALILSKFVIVATLTLGAGAMSSVHGVDQVMAGTAILLLAAFAPFVLFRMVPIAEVAALAHLEGLSRRPARAATGMAAHAGTLARPAGAALSMIRNTASVEASQVHPRPIAAATGTYDPRTGSAPGNEE